MIRINKANAVFVNASNAKDGQFIGFIGSVNNADLNEYNLKVNSGKYAPVVGHIRLRTHENGTEWGIVQSENYAGADNILRS